MPKKINAVVRKLLGLTVYITHASGAVDFEFIVEKQKLLVMNAYAYIYSGISSL